MQELEKAGISGLSENIVNIRADEPLPDKNRYLEKNASYKPVVFSDKLDWQQELQRCIWIQRHSIR